jgi:hypothetical protein
VHGDASEWAWRHAAALPRFPVILADVTVLASTEDPASPGSDTHRFFGRRRKHARPAAAILWHRECIVPVLFRPVPAAAGEIR